MKKTLVLAVILAFSANLTFGATTYTSALKDAIKKDVEASKTEAKNYKQSVKEAIKKDMEAKAKANTSASEAKKAEKVKQLEAKLAELKKEKEAISKSKEMTYTEKTLRTKNVDKQIEFYNKQLQALK